MRLATVCVNQVVRIGVVEGTSVRLLPTSRGDMVSVIGIGRTALEQAASESTEVVPMDAVEILSPLQRFNRDILCTGWKYLEHFEESRGKREGQVVDLPTAPTFFT